jgi:hypothetical protein
MKNIQKISTAALIVGAALALSACGGGGGDSASQSPIKDESSGGTGGGNGGGASPFQKLTGVNGFKIDYQGVFDSGPPASSTWTGSITSPINYTSISNLNTFRLTDGAAHVVDFALSGINTNEFYAPASGARVGGTTYTYSRFGWLYSDIQNATNTPTKWRTPFAVASSTPASPTDATYTGTNQALWYLQSDQTSATRGSFFELKCDSNATYTASSKSLQLSLSNCKTNDQDAVNYDVIVGNVTLAAGTNTSTLGVGSQGVTLAGLSSKSVDSGNFLLAGPNGEELVGAATIEGTYTTYATSDTKPAKFLVIFGGKKS